MATTTENTNIFRDVVVPRTKMSRFAADVLFERKHPFYDDWTDWDKICKLYHSSWASLMSKAINKGSRSLGNEILTDNENLLIDEIYFQHCKICDLANFPNSRYSMKYDWIQGFNEEHDFVSFCFLPCGCMDKVSSECDLYEIHLKSFIIAFMWAFVHKTRPKRSLRRYYGRLEKIILALPPNKLKLFDPKLITDPKCIGSPRHLLRDLYNKGYFQPYSTRDFVEKVEWLKHFRIPQQQGGATNQCFSDSSLFSDEFLECGLDIVSRYSFTDILASQTPHPQGLVAVDHKLPDKEIEKFRTMLRETQESFLFALKDTMVQTGKELFVLFAAAATVALLARLLVTVGFNLVLKLLHMIYTLIFGVESHKDAESSYMASQQSGDSEVTIPFVPSMILNYVINPSKSVLKHVWSNPNIDVIMRRLGYIGNPNTKQGIDNIVDWFKQTIDSVYKWFSLTILGISVPEDINSTCHVITAWNEEVDEIVQQYYKGTFIYSETSFSVIHNLYARGLRFTREQAYKSYKNDVWRLVNKLGNILEKFKNHGMSDQTIRNPPVTIFMSGGTGVGKSSVTYPVAAEILNGINSREQFPIELKKHWKSLIYMRSAEQEFWDGYENQLVTVFDDFNQQVDSASNPNLELFEIIRASNCFPYPLHMASLEQKASTTFTSKIILVSSNLEKPKTNSLNFPEALERRFEICIRVRRIKEIKELHKFDPTVFQFERYDMATGKTMCILSYDEFIHLCVTTYFDRKTYVDSIESYIKDKLDQPYFSGPNWIEADDLMEIPHQQGLDSHHEFAFYNNVINHVPFNESVAAATAERATFYWTHRGRMSYYIHQAKLRMGAFAESMNPIDLIVSPVNRSKIVPYIKEKYLDCWEALSDAVKKIKDMRMELDDRWTIFKYDHPYLSRATVLIGLVVTSLMFLKAFSKLRSFYNNTFSKKPSDESFSPKNIRPAKVESFTPRLVKRAKVESVNPQREAEEEGWFEKKVEDIMWTNTPLQADTIDWVLPQFRDSWKSVGEPKLYYLREGKVIPASESFNPKIIKAKPRVESFNPKLVKRAKVESVPTESITKTGSRNIFMDTHTGLPMEQGIKDINAAEILLKIARRNLYKMYESTAGQAIGHCLFLKGRIVLMPKHYMNGFKQSLENDPDATISFKAVLLNRAFEVPLKDMLDSKVEYQSPDENDGPVYSRDLMAMHIRTAVVHPDATPYFVSKSSVSRVETSSIILPVLCSVNISDADKAVLMLRYAEGRTCLRRDEKLPIADEGTVLRYIRDAWRYSLDTRDTECGAPLIIRNTQVGPGKICGIHVAGITGTGQGWSTPVYAEDIDEIMKAFPEEAKFIQKFEQKLGVFPREQGQVPDNAEFIRLGTIERPLAQPQRSKIEPSLCYEKIKTPITKPCALKPVVVEGALFDPRQYRLGRLGNIPKPISQQLIDNSRDALIDEISTQLHKSQDTFNDNLKAVYTFEEAVCGIDGEPFINAIKRDTSSGFPFIQWPNFTRKDCFGKGADYDLSSSQCSVLKERVMNIIECAKKGEVLDHYFVDTLKDERKPIHKAHKTRLFAAGPLDYLIACKMYFNGVVSLLGKNRNWCHISVGSNPYAEDWGEIARQLLRKSPYMVAGDFEGFDASEHQLLLEACGEVLIKLTVRYLQPSLEDIKIMRVLLVSLFNSLHITGNEVYQWTHSLPSGHYLTAIINSLFVNLAFGCVWQLAFDDVHYITARQFWDECGIVAYGDDHIVSIPPSRLAKFNQLNLPALFEFIGLSYTMEDKDAHATLPSRPLSAVSFLKRKFERDELTGRWLAPLTLDTILEFPMWMHKNPDPKLQTISELENALRELSLHKGHVWKLWSPKLIEELEELGHFTQFKNQTETRMFTMNQEWEM
nr:MAG: hypothetical protein 1 [Dicistroviridae sp.]